MKKRQFGRYFLALLCVFFLDKGRAAEDMASMPVDTPNAIWFECSFRGALDGDTFRCADATRVRLHGIDAPEISHALGNLSRNWLDRHLKGIVVYCVPRGRSFNRIVATCYDQGVDVAAASVAHGMSRDCYRFSCGLYAPLETSRNHLIPVAEFCR